MEDSDFSNHYKIIDMSTPGVLLNKVGVSTSTKPTNEEKETTQFSHEPLVPPQILRKF